MGGDNQCYGHLGFHVWIPLDSIQYASCARLIWIRTRVGTFALALPFEKALLCHFTLLLTPFEKAFKIMSLENAL